MSTLQRQASRLHRRSPMPVQPLAVRPSALAVQGQGRLAPVGRRTARYGYGALGLLLFYELGHIRPVHAIGERQQLAFAFKFEGRVAR
jgi:hypothetical protein